MNEKTKSQFIIELRELLSKYNACISFIEGSCFNNALYDDSRIVIQDNTDYQIIHDTKQDHFINADNLKCNYQANK